MGVLMVFNYGKETIGKLKGVYLPLIMTLLGASPAFAQELSPITNMLTIVGTALTGPIGQAASLIAIIAVGFGAFFGRISWAFAGSVFLGIVLIFSASVILGGFATA